MEMATNSVIKIHDLPSLPGITTGADWFMLDREVQPGTVLSYKVAKSNIVYSNGEIVGGYHQVATISDRDAIPTGLRAQGMTVWVNDSSSLYRLQGGITNSNWHYILDSATEANALVGGYHVVADTTARDAIPSALRVTGMLAYCVATAQTYRLVGGVANINWTLEQIPATANELPGGYHIVTDLTARDAIASSLRLVGMPCYVISEAKAYRLVGGIANVNWLEVAAKTGYIVAADVTARDAVPANLRLGGMLCYVISTGLTYRLVGGILNANWVQEGAVPSTRYDFTTQAAVVVTHGLGRIPEVDIYRADGYAMYSSKLVTTSTITASFILAQTGYIIVR